MTRNNIISAYTTVTNSIKYEYCIEEAIRSVLLFADEVIVLDGGSTDGTLELIESIEDPRIKIHHVEWLENMGNGMYGIAKSLSLSRCISDWCVLFDADEVYHESLSDTMRKIPNSVGPDIIAIKFNTIHFYKDYQHVLNGFSEWKDLYTEKVYMIRNRMGIHHGNINGDPDNFLLSNGQPIPADGTVLLKIPVFHYGHVRSNDAMMAKRNKMERYWHGDSSKCEKIDWVPLEKLSIFDGNHPNVMKDRISIGTDSHTKIVDLYV